MRGLEGGWRTGWMISSSDDLTKPRPADWQLTRCCDWWLPVVVIDADPTSPSVLSHEAGYLGSTLCSTRYGTELSQLCAIAYSVP